MTENICSKCVKQHDGVVFEDAVNGMRVVAITGTNVRKTLEDAGPDKIVDSFDELWYLTGLVQRGQVA